MKPDFSNLLAYILVAVVCSIAAETDFLTCSGSFENPWFCNLPVFNYNPVCNYPYRLTWNYDIQSKLLNIDIFNKLVNKTSFGGVQKHKVKRLAGLIQVHLKNEWFYKPNVLLNETFSWNGANNSTQIIRIDENHYQMRQLIEPDVVKCARIGILMFSDESTNQQSKLLYRASSTNEICTGKCDRFDPELFKKVSLFMENKMMKSDSMHKRSIILEIPTVDEIKEFLNTKLSVIRLKTLEGMTWLQNKLVRLNSLEMNTKKIEPARSGDVGSLENQEEDTELNEADSFLQEIKKHDDKTILSLINNDLNMSKTIRDLFSNITQPSEWLNDILIAKEDNKIVFLNDSTPFPSKTPTAVSIAVQTSSESSIASSIGSSTQSSRNVQNNLIRKRRSVNGGMLKSLLRTKSARKMELIEASTTITIPQSTTTVKIELFTSTLAPVMVENIHTHSQDIVTLPSDEIDSTIDNTIEQTTAVTTSNPNPLQSASTITNSEVFSYDEELTTVDQISIATRLPYSTSPRYLNNIQATLTTKPTTIFEELVIIETSPLVEKTTTSTIIYSTTTTETATTTTTSEIPRITTETITNTEPATIITTSESTTTITTEPTTTTTTTTATTVETTTTEPTTTTTTTTSTTEKTTATTEPTTTTSITSTEESTTTKVEKETTTATTEETTSKTAVSEIEIETGETKLKETTEATELVTTELETTAELTTFSTTTTKTTTTSTSTIFSTTSSFFPETTTLSSTLVTTELPTKTTEETTSDSHIMTEATTTTELNSEEKEEEISHSEEVITTTSSKTQFVNKMTTEQVVVNDLTSLLIENYPETTIEASSSEEITTTRKTTLTTATPATTTLTSSLDNIKLEIMNYTVLQNGSSSASNASDLSKKTPDSKTYSLRLHIKGFKWNEKYNDPNSQEAQSFLKAKILPLLFKNLNLKEDDLNEIKLIRLFKGFNSLNQKNNGTSNAKNTSGV